MPRPVPRPDEVLIEVDRCGICGTDVHIFRGEYLGSYPVTPGHEFSGTRSSRSARACVAFDIGDRVAVEPNMPATPVRPAFRTGRTSASDWQAVGVTLPGGMAEYVCARRRLSSPSAT